MANGKATVRLIDLLKLLYGGRTLRLENGVVALLVSDTQPRRRSVAKRSSSVSSDESYNTATSGEEDSSEQSDEDMHVTDEEDHVTENQDHVTGDDEVEQTSSQVRSPEQNVCKTIIFRMRFGLIAILCYNLQGHPPPPPPTVTLFE